MNSQTSPERPKIKSYELIVAFIALIAIVLPFAVIYLGFRGKTSPISSLQQLSPDVPLQFPSDALLVGGEHQTGLGAYLAQVPQFYLTVVS